MSASVSEQPRASETCPTRIQPLDAVGVAAVRVVELAARPVRESRQSRRSGPDEVVARVDMLDRPLRVQVRRREIPADERHARAVELDGRRHARQLVVVDRHDAALAADDSRPTLGEKQLDRRQLRGHRREPVRDRREVVARHQRADEPHGQHRSRPHHGVGQLADPAADHGLLTTALQRGQRRLGEIRRAVDLARGERMAYGGDRVALAVVPPARARVQARDELGALVPQVRLEHVAEQVVVAVPPATVVERDEEQVRPLQRLEHRLAAGPLERGVAEFGAERVEDRGGRQEPAQLLGLAGRGPRRRGSRATCRSVPANPVMKRGDVVAARAATARRAGARRPSPPCATRASTTSSVDTASPPTSTR